MVCVCVCDGCCLELAMAAALCTTVYTASVGQGRVSARFWAVLLLVCDHRASAICLGPLLPVLTGEQARHVKEEGNNDVHLLTQLSAGCCLHTQHQLCCIMAVCSPYMLTRLPVTLFPLVVQHCMPAAPSITTPSPVSNPPTTTLQSQVLLKLHSDVLPAMSSPLLLCDFLSHALDRGGFEGMLALNGIFTLVTQHGLEYPAFYNRLYGLITPAAFTNKHRSVVARWKQGA